MSTEDFNISISKTLLSTLPQAKFDGRIVVIDKPEDVADAVADLRKSSLIGFDTETRPAFKKGLNHKVSLLQLSTDTVCYLFRLNHIGFHPLLQELLSDSSIKKIGASVHDDFLTLGKLSPFTPDAFVDIQKLVKAYHIIDNSLARIYGILFNERISKGQRLTNWEAETLTAAQQQYAALDAYACIRVYRHLAAGSFNPAGSPYRVVPELPAPEKV